MEYLECTTLGLYTCSPANCNQRPETQGSRVLLHMCYPGIHHDTAPGPKGADNVENW
jgi:hypothetical protein